VINEFIEVTLKDSDAFLKVKETLTRVGVASKKEPTLYQSCHILHKQGKYYIVHFKELFALDGKETNITEEDIGRRNTIARLLAEWGLVTIVSLDKVEFPQSGVSQIKVLSFKEKNDYTLVAKYSIGKKKS